MRTFFPHDDEFKNPLFVGTVEDNNDPTYNYRVKVRIEHLHPANITTENLPWAARVDTAFMGTSDEADLDHRLPQVGTQILVLAVGSNVNSLLYIGTLYKKTTLTPVGKEYLDTYGIYRQDGQFIGIDKVQKLFQMLFLGDVNIDKITNMTINVKNTVSIECTEANIKAQVVNVDAPISTFKGNVAVTGAVTCNSLTAATTVVAPALPHTHLGNLGAPTGPGVG